MFIRFKHIVCILLSGAMLLGLPCCTCKSVQDARQTISMVDSMRVNEGRLYDDSLALAEAYTTFGRWRLVYPNDYARACYYYGYLLRQHGNQVAAMQAFIAGTHAPYIQRVIPLPWFNDYHILGRIYTNMGVMCHLADDFELGYAMYEQSAIAFQKSCDTTAYYYALNAMALELAEQKLHDETVELLNSIEQECKDSGVLTKLWETKAILYYNIEQYDSTIYCAKELYVRGYHAATGYVKEAQAYWRQENNDSALHYANVVMLHPYAASKDKYNVLHILAYDNHTAGADDIKKYTAERSDIDKDILDPLRVQLQQAIDLLIREQEPKATYAPIIILGCLMMLTVVYLLIRRQLKARAYRIREKESELSTKEHELQQSRTSHRQALVQEVEKTCRSLRAKSNLCSRQGMEDYTSVKKLVNKRLNMLVDKLEATHVLSERKIKFCILVLLQVPQKQIADILTYSSESIKNTKASIAKDLKISSSELRNYLIDKVLEEP